MRKLGSASWIRDHIVNANRRILERVHSTTAMNMEKIAINGPRAFCQLPPYAASFLLCRLTQTGESPSFLRWHRKFSLTRRSGATHRRSIFGVKMNTILIFSLVILLFGFDWSSMRL
jgi:hypothetical protein